MPYSDQQIEASRLSNMRAARIRGEVKSRGEFTLVRSVDPVAYHNAIEVNGGVDRNGRHCWHDAEFCKDMDRRHPEIAVRSKSARIIIHTGQPAGCVGRVLTRLGRSSFHKVYG